MDVDTAASLRAAMLEHAPTADVVVMAAAVADFRPVTVAERKIKKDENAQAAPSIALERTEDVLAELVTLRSQGQAAPDQVIIGFAAETGSADAGVVDLGRQKLARKGCDLLVVNDVSGDRVFGRDTTEAIILDRAGADVEVPEGSKSALADTLWDTVAQRYSGHPIQ